MPDLKGRGLFIFSDPGGAKAILAWAQELKAKKLSSDQLIISDRQFDFFSDFDVEIAFYHQQDEMNLFTSFKPDFVFTGTSYTSKIELLFIEGALAHNIVSYSFIDHYSKLIERFELFGRYIFPSFIAVIDQKTFVKAIENGLPEERLIVTGNPYRSFISDWRPSITKELFFKQHNLDPEKKVILYAPDPLTNVGGKSLYGCDEVSGLDNIIECVAKFRNKFQIVIKPHPNQNLKLFDWHLNNTEVRILRTAHLNTLLFYSDIVISFFSNILIEANLLSVRNCRLLIEYTGEDYLNGSEHDDLIKVNSKAELINLLAGV